MKFKNRLLARFRIFAKVSNAAGLLLLIEDLVLNVMNPASTISYMDDLKIVKGFKL